jgi:isoleucyl-tRNA synthetase
MYNANKIEKEVLEFWKSKNIYKKTRDKNKGNKPFYFLQGPPYTSGRLHAGHAWNNSMKDMVLRYKNMKGFHIWDRAGYDMHGLPTASKVQEKLGLKNKEEIIKYGLDKFAKECMDFSVKHAKLMNKDLFNMGVWLDYENAYFPIEEEWIESVWWLIKRAEEQKRLYEGERTMPWCAYHGTALAKHECEYKKIDDQSIFVKLNIKGKDNESLVIWTTTPWTISFNLAVMVNPELDYIRAKVDDEVIIIAKDLADRVIIEVLGKEYSILEEFKGEDLSGLEYVHPFKDSIKDFEKLKKAHPKVHTVILSKKYVNLTAGTGLVHCAPGCGPEDYEVGRENKIPPYNKIDHSGIFPEEFGEMSGWVARKDDQKFIKKLADSGSLLKTIKFSHDYAHCERCHTPVIFRTTKQWFFKVEDLKDKLLSYNTKIHWVPETVKNAFVSWLENLRDNSITKQRFWGTPVPIWRCKTCKDYTVISSKEELSQASGKIPENLHKPWIDEITIDCKCGGIKKRIPDVLDVWIDAGVASWACLYYPKRKDLFEKLFPADFILESREQVRGWYNLLMVSSIIGFDKIPFKAAYSHGMLTDVDGVKMSKSLGNVISPYEIIDKYGADTMRLYFSQTNAGEDINFSWDEIKIKNKNLNVLWNTTNYFLEYYSSVKDKVNINLENLENLDLGIEEKYMLSKLNRTIKQVSENYEFYNLDKVPGQIEDLFLELSREYIKSTREKISKNPEMVLTVIFKVLFEILKMLSTVTPFLTEKIYQTLKQELNLTEESIHHFSWPNPNEDLIDESLEENFSIARQIIQAGLAAREKAKVGVRWPLREIKIITSSNNVVVTAKKLEKLILSKLNIKSIKFEEENNIFELELSPNKTTIGRDFKQDSPFILQNINEEMMQEILRNGATFLEKFNIRKEHLLVKQKIPENLRVSKFKQGSIILETEVNEDLELEGFARELIRRLQDLRKEKGLKKQDKINLAVSTKLDLSNFKEMIKKRVGINNLSLEKKEFKYFHNFKIKDEEFEIYFEVLTT